MSVEDFSARLEAKRKDTAALRSHTDDQLVAQQILTDAVEQMRETVDDEDVVRLLRRAIAFVEGAGN